jgi:fido (protein-threonine AMPylation protein)
VVAGLAELHHRFLRIHPFMDANGRLARSITDQAARELLNESIGREFIEDVRAYYAALAAAETPTARPAVRTPISAHYRSCGNLKVYRRANKFTL